MNEQLYPTLSPFFETNMWSTTTASRLREELMKAIAQDPEITKKDNISVVIEDQTPKEIKEIGLVGEVADENERRRAEQIVQVNTKNEVPVNNQLHVAMP